MKNTENDNKKYFLDRIKKDFDAELILIKPNLYGEIDIDLKDIERRADRSGNAIAWLTAYCIVQIVRRWKLRIES